MDEELQSQLDACKTTYICITFPITNWTYIKDELQIKSVEAEQLNTAYATYDKHCNDKHRQNL